ncbi:MAG: ParB/RepB/Spo0J family partition protein [Acidobacteria bacterium]|nr:MAG: ParB/RepB/Spo0J family partition protein [Acidobacteriota bacterium]
MKGEPKRRALGKGLGSLIPDVPPGGVDLGGAPQDVEIARIRPNPQQPRREFDEAEIDALAESIRNAGVLQPLLVRKDPDGRYTLIAGERRLRAARKAGLARVPVIVRDLPDEKFLEIALIENLQRDDLGPIETALAFRELVRRLGLSQTEVAERLGKPRSTVANYLRLLELPEEVRELLEKGRLEMGHGRALAGLRDPVAQVALARKAVARGWSVRELEEQVRRASDPLAGLRRRDAASRRDPNVAAAERTLARALQSRVTIHQTRAGRGRIEIRFANDDDLQRLYSLLLRASGASS